MSSVNETWKKVFVDKVSSGSFWKNLFKEEFDRHKFIDRSDAVYICQKAQEDTYKNILSKLEGKVDSSIISEIENDIKILWNTDISALGLK